MTRPARPASSETDRRHRRPSRPRSTRRVGLSALLVLVLTAFVLLAPVPLYALSPGGAFPLAERVDFPTRSDDDGELSGRLLLLTVDLAPATLAEALAGWLSPYTDVVARDEVIPPGSRPDQYFAAQRDVFAEAGEVAAAVGLRAAGLPVTLEGAGGARVLQVVPGSPADGRLMVGDTITELGGEPVSTAADLVSAVAQAPAGEATTLTVTRAGLAVEVVLTPGRYAGSETPGLGVLTRTLGHRVELPFPVDVDAGRIGGPSAGLMTALTVFDLADPVDLTAGRVVAGTGTLDADGRVGPVGGVPQKVEAAVLAGSDLFLVPETLLAQARDAADGRLEVIGVATLRDAVDALTAPAG